MKNKPTHYGLLLVAITLILFFAVYFCFIGFNYYIISIQVNFFVLPALYTLVSIVLLYKLTNYKKLSFLKCLQYSFTTMFIGGTLSYLLIALFFNYIDLNAQQLLQDQGLNKMLENLNSEYESIQNPSEEITLKYNEYVNYLKVRISRNESFFTIKNSCIILSVLCFFYFIISVLLSIFFRTRISNATIYSHSPTQ
ncbi:MAG: DUF4199 domain-containing protein [Apibacter sp.]|nr:DUF4199 domain-containing protein [Apibacter sp.]